MVWREGGEGVSQMGVNNTTVQALTAKKQLKNLPGPLAILSAIDVGPVLAHVIPALLGSLKKFLPDNFSVIGRSKLLTYKTTFLTFGSLKRSICNVSLNTNPLPFNAPTTLEPSAALTLGGCNKVSPPTAAVFQNNNIDKNAVPKTCIGDFLLLASSLLLWAWRDMGICLFSIVTIDEEGTLCIVFLLDASGTVAKESTVETHNKVAMVEATIAWGNFMMMTMIRSFLFSSNYEYDGIRRMEQ